MQSQKSWGVALVIMLGAMAIGYFQSLKDEPIGEIDSSDGELSSSRVVLHKLDAQQNNKEVKRETVLMGSHFVFMVDAPEKQALAAIRAVSDRIKDLEQTISSWVPGSDVARLNESAGIRPVLINDDTMEILKLSKVIHKETGGSFDITIGPVWDLWPFAKNLHKNIPTEEEIEEKKELVDASAIVLDEEKSTAYLPKSGMRVNLGAIGKGYAAEMGIRLLRERGIQRAAISAGGDIYLLGKKSSGLWVVDIEHPRWEGRTLEQFSAENISIATSGDAKQFVVRNGKRYGHILNPITGRPVNRCQSVTIVTASSALADAYATAVFVMGPEKGIQWVNDKAGVEALIVNSDGIKIRSTGWNDFVKRGIGHDI